MEDDLARYRKRLRIDGECCDEWSCYCGACALNTDGMTLIPTDELGLQIYHKRLANKANKIEVDLSINRKNKRRRIVARWDMMSRYDDSDSDDIISDNDDIISDNDHDIISTDEDVISDNEDVISDDIDDSADEDIISSESDDLDRNTSKEQDTTRIQDEKSDIIDLAEEHDKTDDSKDGIIDIGDDDDEKYKNHKDQVLIDMSENIPSSREIPTSWLETDEQNVLNISNVHNNSNNSNSNNSNSTMTEYEEDRNNVNEDHGFSQASVTVSGHDDDEHHTSYDAKSMPTKTNTTEMNQSPLRSMNNSVATTVVLSNSFDQPRPPGGISSTQDGFSSLYHTSETIAPSIFSSSSENTDYRDAEDQEPMTFMGDTQEFQDLLSTQETSILLTSGNENKNHSQHSNLSNTSNEDHQIILPSQANSDIGILSQYTKTTMQNKHPHNSSIYHTQVKPKKKNISFHEEVPVIPLNMLDDNPTNNNDLLSNTTNHTDTLTVYSDSNDHYKTPSKHKVVLHDTNTHHHTPSQCSTGSILTLPSHNSPNNHTDTFDYPQGQVAVMSPGITPGITPLKSKSTCDLKDEKKNTSDTPAIPQNQHTHSMVDKTLYANLDQSHLYAKGPKEVTSLLTFLRSTVPPKEHQQCGDIVGVVKQKFPVERALKSGQKLSIRLVDPSLLSLTGRTEELKVDVYYDGALEQFSPQDTFNSIDNCHAFYSQDMQNRKVSPQQKQRQDVSFKGLKDTLYEASQTIKVGDIVVFSSVQYSKHKDRVHVKLSNQSNMTVLNTKYQQNTIQMSKSFSSVLFLRILGLTTIYNHNNSFYTPFPLTNLLPQCTHTNNMTAKATKQSSIHPARLTSLPEITSNNNSNTYQRPYCTCSTANPTSITTPFPSNKCNTCSNTEYLGCLGNTKIVTHDSLLSLVKVVDDNFDELAKLQNKYKKDVYPEQIHADALIHPYLLHCAEQHVIRCMLAELQNKGFGVEYGLYRSKNPVDVTSDLYTFEKTVKRVQKVTKSQYTYVNHVYALTKLHLAEFSHVPGLAQFFSKGQIDSIVECLQFQVAVRMNYVHENTHYDRIMKPPYFEEDNYRMLELPIQEPLTSIHVSNTQNGYMHERVGYTCHPSLAQSALTELWKQDVNHQYTGQIVKDVKCCQDEEICQTCHLHCNGNILTGIPYKEQENELFALLDTLQPSAKEPEETHSMSLVSELAKEQSINALQCQAQGEEGFDNDLLQETSIAQVSADQGKTQRLIQASVRLLHLIEDTTTAYDNGFEAYDTVKMITEAYAQLRGYIPSGQDLESSFEVTEELISSTFQEHPKSVEADLLCEALGLYVDRLQCLAMNTK